MSRQRKFSEVDKEDDDWEPPAKKVLTSKQLDNSIDTSSGDEAKFDLPRFEGFQRDVSIHIVKTTSGLSIFRIISAIDLHF